MRWLATSASHRRSSAFSSSSDPGSCPCKPHRKFRRRYLTPFHLAFGLCPIGPAQPRCEAPILGKVEERAVPLGFSALVHSRDDRLHTVVEDLARYAAQLLERRSCKRNSVPSF